MIYLAEKFDCFCSTKNASRNRLVGIRFSFRTDVSIVMWIDQNFLELKSMYLTVQNVISNAYPK
jgi:hypothetical protein